MKATELKRYRKALVEKRGELLDRVHAVRTSEAQNREKEAPDLGDRALSTVTRELQYQLTSGERDMLRLIEAAIKRADEGDFGVCVACSKNVQTGRLQAVPWARHCIDCQELQDQGEL
ncbi:MAG: TraR/DksA family transcriptional regulator [bacterium]|nr:TraR/DksA family transcriptional regulator [bacterium]